MTHPPLPPVGEHPEKIATKHDLQATFSHDSGKRDDDPVGHGKKTARASARDAKRDG